MVSKSSMFNLKRSLFIVFCLVAAATHAGASTFVKASDDRFVFMGRISRANPETVAWTYPGVQILCRFTGTSVSMKTNPGSGFYIIKIDDRQPFKVESKKGEDITAIAKNLNEGEHTLSIIYAIEGHGKKPVFYGLFLDDNAQLLEPPSLPERKIEFIGNSITCGYGIEGNGKEKTFYYSLQNFCLTYAYITAQALQAQYHVVARSGIGVYRNYMGKIPEQIMPFIYPHTMYTTKGELWDFSLYQPDIVCVALGTNDTTGSYSVTGLTGGFRRFVAMLRERYINAKIVFLVGPMMGEKRRNDLKTAQQTVIDEYAAMGDNNIYTFEFQESDKTLGMGSQGHPNAAHHAQMADELIPYLRDLMQWD